jgi:integrase/recombinase XerD
VFLNDNVVIEAWINSKRSATGSAYAFECRRFLRFLGARKLADLDIIGAQAFESILPRHESTRNRAVSAIRSLYAFACEHGYLIQNPIAVLRLEPVRDTLHERILSPEEVEAIIKAEPRPRVRLLIRLIYFGGLRISEAIELQWKNITERGDKGSAQVTVFGKGGKTRTILLEPDFAAGLIQLMKSKTRSDFIFMTRTGNHIDRGSAWRLIRSATRKAGIDRPVSPHWFRHAHATHALKNGADLKLIQETLGHSSIETTGRYVHNSPGESSSQFLKIKSEE